MSKAKSHKEVEYEVGRLGARDRIQTFKEFDKATAAAFALALSGEDTELRVICWSRAGAKWLGGDEAVEQYDEDPEASVFNAYTVRVTDRGRIA